MAIKTDVIIIGGGLSGLALADRLQSGGISYQLFEAHSSLGGRIKVHQELSLNSSAAYDLGPSWFWPGQTRIQALIKRFGIEVFSQYSEGTQRFEDQNGAVQHGGTYASMEGSLRIQGGMITLISHLARALNTDCVHLNTQISGVRKSKNIEAIGFDGEVLAEAKHLVLALPPRVAASLRFTPKLPESTFLAMKAVPTWMAGQAKFCAVYEAPFWRAQGLSGDAVSRAGPLAEIHDATDPTSDNGALFGFVGVALARRMDQEALIQASLAQLARIFGPEALSPISALVKDWAIDSNIATQMDSQPLNYHPVYGLPGAMADVWGNCLLFSSSEMAPHYGGYLEGALEAAENTARLIVK